MMQECCRNAKHKIEKNAKAEGRTEMTKEVVINIAEEFSKWLEDMAEKYEWHKDDVQDLIRQFLM